MKKDNKETSKNQNQTYYGGLTFKEFKGVGKVPIEGSDVFWAGRLFSKFPYWSNKVTKTILFFFFVTVISLVVIWGSILSRSPPLLLGVYPNGQLVCFPQVKNKYGKIQKLPKVYQKTCSDLNKKLDVDWQLKNLNKKSNQQAIGKNKKHEEYAQIGDGDYIAYLNKQSKDKDDNKITSNKMGDK